MTDAEARVVVLEGDLQEAAARIAARNDLLRELEASTNARIAALESEQRDYERTCVRLNGQVARVRELCADVHRQCAQAQYDPELQSIAGFANDVENALAADAPESKEPR